MGGPGQLALHIGGYAARGTFLKLAAPRVGAAKDAHQLPAVHKDVREEPYESFD